MFLLTISGSTALHSLEHGFRTVLIEDASCGVDLTDIEKMRQKLKRQGAVVVQSSAVSFFYRPYSCVLQTLHICF